MKRLLILGFVLPLFGGCRTEDVLPADPKSLLGDWVLVQPNTASQTTLSFGLYTGIINGNLNPYFAIGKAPVNDYSASVLFSPDNTPIEQRRLTVKLVRTTKRAGTSEAMQAEDEYLAKLQTVTRYELTNRSRLRLYYGQNNTGILVYQRQ